MDPPRRGREAPRGLDINVWLQEGGIASFQAIEIKIAKHNDS